MATIVPSSSPSTEGLDVTVSIPQGTVQEMGRIEKPKEDSQQRGLWLRTAVLGANDGLVTTASLMLGVGAVQPNKKTVVVSGLAALVAGACSMAIGEFVSVYAQRDAQLSDIKIRANKLAEETAIELQLVQQLASDSPFASPTAITTPSPATSAISKDDDGETLPNPFQAALASSMAFCVGGVVPLLSAAFITNYLVRVGIVAGVSSVTLAAFGALGAYYGRSPIVKGTLRVLIGGWMAMLVTYGLLKLLGTRV